MIDTGAIRKKILDSAIAGQLGLNNLNESAPALPDVDESIDEADKIFAIPLNWRWAKIGWVMSIERGGSPRPIKSYLTDSDDGINWIKIGDVEKGGKYILQTKEKIKPEGEKKSRRVYPGDFLLTNSMSFGRPYISKIQGCVHDGWLILRNTNGLFYYDFLYHLLSSSYMSAQFTKKATGSTVDNLNIDKVADAVIPVPPIDEQKRIVERIEMLFNNVDIIDTLQQQYANNITSLNKKILGLAVRGKLVPQDPNDEPASVLLKKIAEEKQKLIKEGKIKKQKALPAITEDEVPFDIPKSWEFVRLGEVIDLLSGIDFTPTEYSDISGKTIYITGASCLSDTGVIEQRWTDTPKNMAYRGDLLLVCKGSGYGKTVICDVDEAHIARQIMAIKKIGDLNLSYIKYFLKSKISEIKRNGQGVIPGIDRGSILNMILPLPPLEEQHRIVDQIELLIKYVDDLAT